MSNDEPSNCENEDLETIPREQQEISTDEIVEADYEVVPAPSEDRQEEDRQMRTFHEWRGPPGRTHLDDSIDASSEDLGGTQEGHLFSAGYESSMATRIGDEEKSDPKAERLRELHEGRHRSDGEHSVRESERDKKRVSQSISSTLPLASHERKKVISVVQSLDFSRFGNQKALIKVTLGVVAVVIDEREREAESFNELISRSPEFRSICDSHEISMSDLSTVKPRVREALDEGEVIIPQGEELTNRDPALPGPTPTEERPEVYWRERSAEYWAWTAQRWEHLPDEFKKGIPKKYRDRVGQLRHWAPWKDEESEATSDDENRSTEERIDLLKEDVQSLKGDLEELKEIEKEAEKLVREMESETIEDN